MLIYKNTDYRYVSDYETALPVQLNAGDNLLSIAVYSLYESRSRAAYWDGRNSVGEPVASGIYFYTLTAGNFAQTRRMLILK